MTDPLVTVDGLEKYYYENDTLFLVTARVHIPMNDRIATWSPVSPPDEWVTIQARWGQWNHVRTTAAVVSFALYLAAILSFGS